MLKRLITLSLLTLVIACGGRNVAPIEGDTLKETVKVYIDDSISYYDPIIIASNIKQECNTLGNDLSDYIQTYSKDYNIEIIQVEDVSSVTNGYAFDLKIRNAVSAGNAWTGHKKQVLIAGNLLKDSNQVKDFTASRNSMGGFFAGFKGSCDVLDRTVNTLGKDTAAWLSQTL